MGSLTFIGFGLDGDGRGISLSALEAIEKSDLVYLEIYTNPVNDQIASKLSKLTSKNIEEVSRDFVEDGRKILENSLKKEVVLISPGDPMVATTHTELRVRGEELGIKTKMVHNASILTALPGELGLHTYKIGRVVTLTVNTDISITAVYETVCENLVRGLHTIILLEYDNVSKKFVDPCQALKVLVEAEETLRHNIFSMNTFVMVASRIGRNDQFLIKGKIKALLKEEFKEPPHVIVIPADLHFTEKDAARVLLNNKKEEVPENMIRATRLAARMVSKYTVKTTEALKNTRKKINNDDSRFSSLLENVEAYTSDAERFLNEGKDELAILSIGYAEGLLDALRFTRELDVDW